MEHFYLLVRTIQRLVVGCTNSVLIAKDLSSWLAGSRGSSQKVNRSIRTIHVGTKLYLPASLGIWGSEPASKPLAGVPPAPPASTAGFGLGKPAPYIFRAGQAQPI